MSNWEEEHNRENSYDGKVLEKMNKGIRALKAAKTAEIENLGNENLARIKALQAEKHKFFLSPITKEELLTEAKKNLREFKENFRRGPFADHLRQCQIEKKIPFGMNLYEHVFNPQNGFRYSLLAISEKDIEEAVKQLEDIGVPEAERLAKIEKINKEIDELSSGIVKEAQGLPLVKI
jgi:hypothetical protein